MKKLLFILVIFFLIINCKKEDVIKKSSIANNQEKGTLVFLIFQGDSDGITTDDFVIDSDKIVVTLILSSSDNEFYGDFLDVYIYSSADNMNYKHLLLTIEVNEKKGNKKEKTKDIVIRDLQKGNYYMQILSTSNWKVELKKT